MARSLPGFWQDEISTQARTQTHRNTKTHTQGRCGKHGSAGGATPPQLALTHWLVDCVMGLSLTHWLRYVITRKRPPFPPPSVPHSGRPPLVSMQFLAEREAPCLPPSLLMSGGWQQGWGAKRKAGQEEDAWRAEGDDLTHRFRKRRRPPFVVALFV